MKNKTRTVESESFACCGQLRHKSCVHHAMDNNAQSEANQSQPTGMSRFLAAVARFPNQDKMLADMVTPAVRDQANKVEKRMGLLAALELIHTLGPGQVTAEKVSAGGKKSGAKRRKRWVVNRDAEREITIDAAYKTERAGVWKRRKESGINTPPRILAHQLIPQVAEKTAVKYIRDGLALMVPSQAHLWPVGKQGPKGNLPSNR